MINILLTMGANAAVAGLANWLWPAVCVVTAVPYTVFLVAGIALLAVGVPILVVAVEWLGGGHDEYSPDS